MTTPDPTPGSDILLVEPFRVLFPVGVLATLVGVVPWLSFALGWAQPPAGYTHGMLQIQAFEAAFAAGFLMTALPRFLETTQTRWWELLTSLSLCLGLTVALGTSNWRVGQWLFLALMTHLLIFVGRRLVTRGDDPPPFLAFVPIGLLAGFLGALTILWPVPGLTRLGERLVQQGVLIPLILAIGSHLGPRLLYGPRPFPETTTPAAHRRFALLLGLGIMLLASFLVEAAVNPRLGMILRALIVSGYLLIVLRVYRPPTQNLFHLHLLRLSFFLLPLGLWIGAFGTATQQLSALHLTFVGGLGLMTFIIASRVVIGHAGFEDLWDNHRVPLALPLGLIAIATPVRLAADAFPAHYAQWLGASAAAWLLGVALWGIWFIPKMSPRHVAPD